MKFENNQFIDTIAETLSSKEILSFMYKQANLNTPMPNVKELHKVIEKLRAVLFPGYFGTSTMKKSSMKFYTGYLLDEIYHTLSEEINHGYCFNCVDESKKNCDICEEMAKQKAKELIKQLPLIRHLLATDAKAAYEGDPASKSFGEIIFCYPVIKALTNYRIAHELFKIGVPIIPRIISEMAHSETGIDIHPGATINESFFIDHGTGVVIGETCVIGKNVRIYQNVTLGAKSFPLDNEGNPIKDIDRHPKIEDNVIIYSGATILGNITIGKNSTIGGNIWLTKSVPADSKINK